MFRLIRLAVALILIILVTVALWAQVTNPRGTVQPGTPPTLASLSVTTGQYGTAVTVTGTGFGATQVSGAFVSFNGIAAPVSSWSDTSIVVAVPVNATSGSVTVIEGGAPSNAITFTIATPVLSSLSITSGNVGDPVTLTGTNFGTTQGLSRVTFNGVTATVTSWAGTSLATTVPAGATTGSVVVTVGATTTAGITFTLGAPPAGEQIFVAQAAAGGNTGANCANAKAYTFFNASANWSATVLPSDGKISPGDTVHICGTITGPSNTTLFTFQGNGLSGNPVTLKWEAGAILQAPWFPGDTGGAGCGGAVCGVGHSFLTIDGGSYGNGIIRNTANNSTSWHASMMVDIHTCNNCTVTNLNLTPFQRTVTPDDTSDDVQTRCIQVSGSHNLITFTQFHAGGWCLFFNWDNNDTDNEFAYNYFDDFAHAIVYADHEAQGVTNGRIHDNEFSATTIWDTSSGCGRHQDDIHVFGGGGTTNDGLYVYNNYHHGSRGLCPTGYYFVEGGGSSDHSHLKNSWWFNNVIVTPAGDPYESSQGMIGIFAGDATSATYVVANTYIGNGVTNNSTCYGLQMLNSAIFKNNLVSACQNPISDFGVTAWAINWNLYAGSIVCASGGNCFAFAASYGPQYTYSDSFANWKTRCGCDANSLTPSSASINADGSLQVGSVAVGAGENLATTYATALNAIPAAVKAAFLLDTSKGNTRTPTARPAAGGAAWDIGAYNH